jgi:hypothetical protein
MQGYCPTRANQAPLNGPRVGPQIVWSVTPFPITTPEDFLPAEIVVDPSGRAYVAIEASPMNLDGSGMLFAVDPDGTVGWSAPANAASLVLASDGNLWLMGDLPDAPTMPTNPVCLSDAGFDGPTCLAGLTALSSAGAVVEHLVLVIPAMSPSVNSVVSYNSFAPASDGSIFLEGVSPIGSEGGVGHASRDGTMLWQWPPPSQNEGFLLVAPLVVGPDDDAVVSGSGELFHLDAAGNQIWQDGVGVQTAAVDARGETVALTTSGGPTGDGLALVTIDPVGDVTQRPVSFGATANVFQLALAGDGTNVMLLANEATAPGLTKSHVEITAVDGSGTTRWTTPLDVDLDYDPATLTTHYGLFVDAAGTVVVTAGAITGIDLSTGAILWTVQAPNAHSCLRPAALGAGGAILASQCDGTVFLARDP